MSRAPASVDGGTVSIAVSTALGFASIRVFTVLLYGLRESRGTPAALAVASAVFFAPIASPVLEKAVGRRGARVIAIGGLAIAAVAMQFARPIPWWLGAGATGLALITWTLLLLDARSPPSNGGAAFTLAFVAGMVIDTAVHASFETWDPMWRPGSIAAIPTVVLAIVLLVAIRPITAGETPPRRETSFARVLSVAALGPFLVLQVLFLHNVAFVDAATGSALGGGAATVLVGETLACLLVSWGPRPARWASAGGAVLCASLAWMLPALDGAAAVITVIAASGIAGLGLCTALSGGGEADRAASWRTSLSLALGALVFAALVFADQIHATSPLPFSNRLLPPLAAIMLGAACLGSATTGRDRDVVDRRLVVVVLVVTLTVPLALLVAVPAPASVPSDAGSLRILSWNVHAAVDANGQLVPDVVADQIEARRADVVVLQEVARGWPIGGALDFARWLSARLEMPFVWGPAADEQFGNLVLSRLPIVSSESLALPFGAGPQHRSMLRVTLDTVGGPVTIVGAHLEAGAGTDTDTRTKQIQVLIDKLRDEPRTVIAGDMNMQPADSADVALFADAGFVSAQDEAGKSALSTARDPRFPGDRPDWIFVTPDLGTSGFRIAASGASDHRPLVVDVTV